MKLFNYDKEKVVANRMGDKVTITEFNVPKAIAHGALGLVLLSTVAGGFYTVPEGHVGIEKTFGEATAQVSPGLHFKFPFVQSVEEMEVRTKKNVRPDISVATSEQLPARADVSVNWTVNKASGLDIFVQYGGLDQFESRILTPAINSAAKDAIAKYKAEDIIKNRNVVVTAMKDAIVLAMSPYDITVNSVQLEDIQFPSSFTNAIEAKLKALQDAIKEEHKLKQQALQAQQQVQTAQAQADAKRKAAEAEAFRIKVEAEAQAAANKLIAESLTPELIRQLQIEAWKEGGSQVPKFVSGDAGGQFLFNLPTDK